MSARAAVILAIGIAILIIAVSNMGEVGAPTTSSLDDSVVETFTVDAEEWVAFVAENGVEHMSTGTSSNERDEVSKYVTMGPLSSRGREALMSTIQSEIEEVQTALDVRLSANQEGDAVSLGQYDRDFKMVARLELLRARAELVRNGVYITIPMSSNTAESVPREPVGVVSATYGPYEVEAGELAQVLLWVTSDKREIMREVNQSLREVHAALREEWIADFNAASEDVRRAWFARYRTLSASQGRGVSQMSNADIAEWLSLRQTMRHFSLQLSEETWTVR